MNVRAMDALDQALDLVTLLEFTCAGMDVEAATGMILVLHEIESRLKDVWEGIDTGDDAEGGADGFTLAQIVDVAKELGVHYEDMVTAISKVGETSR